MQAAPAVVFELTQPQIDAELARQKESRLAGLPPICRFLRDTPAPAEVAEGEEAPRRAEPTTFRTKPLTQTSCAIDLQLSAIEAGEAVATVTARERVAAESVPLTRRARARRAMVRVGVLGGVCLTAHVLW